MNKKAREEMEGAAGMMGALLKAITGQDWTYRVVTSELKDAKKPKKAKGKKCRSK